MRRSKRVILSFVALAFGVALMGAVYWAYREFVPHFESESHLRARLEQSGSLALLKQWAMDRVGTKPAGDITLEQLPVNADAIHLLDVFPDLNPDGTIRNIDFQFGGGFRHCGLVIGEPPENGRPPFPVHRWDKDILYYDEELGAPE